MIALEQIWESLSFLYSWRENNARRKWVKNDSLKNSVIYVRLAFFFENFIFNFKNTTSFQQFMLHLSPALW